MPQNERTIPAQSPRSIANYTLVSDGEAVPRSYHLLSVQVKSALNRIPFAQLILLDGEAAQETFELSSADYFAPGREVALHLGYGDEQHLLFEGRVTRHQIKVRGRGSVLMVECRAAASLLTLANLSRHFLDRSDSEIMEEIIQGHGLEAQVEPTNWVHGQMVQHDASDWDFLICRAEANGYLVRAEGRSLVVGPPDLAQEPVLRIQFGATVHELDAQIDARWQWPELKALTWDSAEQETASRQAEEPDASLAGNLQGRDLAQDLGVPEGTLRHGASLSEPELQQWVDARLLKHRLARIRGTVTIDGTAAVQPGQCVELLGVGDRFQGKLFVSAVGQVLEKGQWRTILEFGLSPRWFVEDFEVQAPAAGGVIPPASGLHLGRVVALEGDPQHHHRIQVQLPLFHSSQEGIWARLGLVDAGADRGMAWRPEIGDEVVVGFIHEDPRHAVVLGSLHSARHNPPWEAQDDNHRKGYRSRSGIEYLIDDENKELIFRTPSGNQLRFSEADEGIFLEDQHGNQIIMNGDGIQLKSKKDIQIEAGLHVKVDAGGDFQGKAGKEARMEGSVAAEFSSGGNTVLKGAMVQIN